MNLSFRNLFVEFVDQNFPSVRIFALEHLEHVTLLRGYSYK